MSDKNVAVRRLSATDLSQFVRLEQCERYLRLRMTDRRLVDQMMTRYGVAPQALSPLLSRSGRAFEQRVQEQLFRRFPTRDCALDRDFEARGTDNALLLNALRSLPPGEARVLLQARLEAGIDDWSLHGDPDVLRLARDADGRASVLIVDVKSSARVRTEHRLQVAFYHAMLDALLRHEGEADVELRTGIVYRGPSDPSPEEQTTIERHRADARRWLELEEALLDLTEEPAAYLESVGDLVTDPGSIARRIAESPFDTVPFHLSPKCDGCLYNQLCMKWAAVHDDLSLIPHLTAGDKRALERAGVRTARELAALKEPAMSDDPLGLRGLVPAPGREEQVKRIAALWPIGPRLDELVYRARAYRQWKGDPVRAPRDLPNKGHSSLPHTGPALHPNLVRVYLDAQRDYLEDRLYLVGALVAACENGMEVPHRRRSVVRMTDGPPVTPAHEEGLLRTWIDETLRAIVETAAPDEEGLPRAPIHLIFFSAREQEALLEALARHFTRLAASTPLYDFLTQLAAFDSPVATFLETEIRERKNYPLVCQSLAAVASHLRFDWDRDLPYRALLRDRLFDFWAPGEEGDAAPWFFSRARFGSQIPLEYAYRAWGELDPGDSSPAVTPDLLCRFQQRRLEAMEWIARDFRGNDLTRKSSFALPELDRFADRATTLARALDEFVTIERHVALAAWKATRQIPPERRVLMGETLLCRYHDEDQEPELAAANRENRERHRLRQALEAAQRAAGGPVATPPSKEEREACRWSQAGLRFRLRLAAEGVDADLDEILALTNLREGDRVVIFSRWTQDERLPPPERVPFTPTPKQMLYGTRATLLRLHVTRDAHGKAVSAAVEIEMARPHKGTSARGFTFSAMERPFEDGACYTLDPDPNDWYGSWCAKVTEALVARADEEPGLHALYDRVRAPGSARVEWPEAARDAQERFLAGLDALYAAGALHAFEAAKRAYIGGHGADPILLVQGPPGTGKSYATAFALFARLQGAMAADRAYRILLSCKTHAATDVLLHNVVTVQQKLRTLRERHPRLFDAYLDPRLLEVPLLRAMPRGAVPNGVIGLPKDAERTKGQPRAVDAIMAHPWCVVAATPGGVYTMLRGRWGGKDDLLGHHFCDLLVLDEASQMNLPEAMMAALPLRPEAPLIVVGDHRQMPPIVQHNWEAERRRTFQEFAAYESLFLALRPIASALLQFEESFRLHAAMAEFLRREIYRHDGIRFHSRRRELLPPVEHADPFVQAVLAAEHPLVVIVHGEAASQTRNPFEQMLVEPVLEALAKSGADAATLAEAALGVVVTHRAQRAALQRAFPFLAVIDPATQEATGWAIDTVERFQGGERDTILACTTESDRDYLLAASEFLLDPRRLTVAISRARKKLILVAARSVFSLFCPDEETFTRARLWKSLLRRTCTLQLWNGERHGVPVEVWGVPPEYGVAPE